MPADRLSDGLCHRQRTQGDPDGPVAADHDADLDRDPDPRVCLDGHSQQQRPAQQLPDVAGPDRSTAADPQHQPGGVHRRGLFVPAVHDPAALRQPGEARHQPVGSGFRPGFEHLQQLLENHYSTVEERHHRRLHAGVHPGGG
ncbi:hypothetical protein D3C72_1906930 [compost metagenome]